MVAEKPGRAIWQPGFYPLMAGQQNGNRMKLVQNKIERGTCDWPNCNRPAHYLKKNLFTGQLYRLCWKHKHKAGARHVKIIGRFSTIHGWIDVFKTGLLKNKTLNPESRNLNL